MKRRVADGFIIEADGKFRAILLREGTSKNGNVWTRKMVEDLVPLADGVPVHLYDMSADGDSRYLSHWEALRQKLPPKIRALLPSRLPDATVGTIVSPSVQVVDGKAQLEGDIQSDRPKTIQGLIHNAKRLGRALGLSIHVDEADISARGLKSGGLEPTVIRKVTGWDIVSFPSAGGQFFPVLEAWTKEDREMKNLVRKLLGLLTDDQRETVTEAVGGTLPSEKITKASTLVKDHEKFCVAILEALDIEIEIDKSSPVLEGLVKGIPDEESEPKTKTRKKVEPKIKLVVEGEEGDPVSRTEFDDARKETRKLLEMTMRTQITAIVEDAKLSEKMATFATKHWVDLLESHGDVNLDDVQEFVADLKSSMGRLTNANRSALEGDEGDERLGIHGSWNTGDKYMCAFEAMMEDRDFGVLEGGNGEKTKVPALHGIRHSYSMLTGDLHMEGMAYHTRPIREKRRLGMWEDIDWESNPMFREYRAVRGSVLEVDLTTATYPLLLSNLINKMMVKEYMALPEMWRLVARSIRANDFKDMIFHKFGEFPNFADVAESDAYLEVTAYPSEEDVTWAIQKRGGWAKITLEMIRNDDLDQIKRYPGKMARAGMRTLNAHVYALLVGNYEPDAKLIIHADHNNIVTTAHSYANLQSLRLKMHMQTDIDSIEAGRIRPTNVLCGPEIYDEMYDLLFTDGKPNLAETGTVTGADTATETHSFSRQSERQPNILRSKYGLGLHEVHDMDANDYLMVGNPNIVDMVVVAFLDNQRIPELFVQDMEKVGSMFTNDQIIYKLRHIYKGVVVDYKPFAGGTVA